MICGATGHACIVHHSARLFTLEVKVLLLLLLLPVCEVECICVIALWTHHMLGLLYLRTTFLLLVSSVSRCSGTSLIRSLKASTPVVGSLYFVGELG
jgi:hypothetical protein